MNVEKKYEVQICGRWREKNNWFEPFAYVFKSLDKQFA